MTSESDRAAPALTPRALAQKQARAQREAAALRENLRRRKLQARTRQAMPDETSEAEAAAPETDVI